MVPAVTVAGLVGTRFHSFLPTNGLVSSNRAALAVGGSSHEFVVESGGVVAGLADLPGDGDRVGGGAIICPVVTLGSRSVVGAGSVVTRDIPDGVFTVGNSCHVVRELLE